MPLILIPLVAGLFGGGYLWNKIDDKYVDNLPDEFDSEGIRKIIIDRGVNMDGPQISLKTLAIVGLTVGAVLYAKKKGIL